MGVPTANKGYLVPTLNGDNGTYGIEINGDLATIDLNLGGAQTISVAGNSNITVSATQAQYLATVLTGALTGNIQYILPAVGGLYIIKNGSSGAYTITVLTSAAGSTGIAVPQGMTLPVWSDGTNVYLAQSGLPSGTYAFNISGNAATATTASTASAVAWSGITGVAAASPTFTAVTAGTFSCTGGATAAGTGCYLTASSVQTTAAAWSVSIGIASANGMSAAGFYAPSDVRVKTDIIDILPREGVDWVMAARPRHYWKDGHPEAGFIAQEELANGRGEAVIQIKDDREMFAKGDGFAQDGHRLAINYDHHIAYLTAALQSALQRIAALEARP
jgi:hypothetical protein